MSTRVKITYKFIVGFTAFYTAVCCIADNPQLGISKDDILNVLLSQQDQFEDLSFSFNMERIIKDKETLQVVEKKREKVSLSTKDDLFRTKRQYFENRREGEALVWDHEWSADGKTVYHLDTPSMFGTVETKLPGAAAIKQNWGTPYLLACWRLPLREPGHRIGGANLIGELQEHIYIKLLPELELFEGRKTVVLDIPQSGRLYLGPKIGFAVVGFVSKERGLHRVNSRFREVLPGFWLPMHSEWQSDHGSTIEEAIIEITDLQVNRGLTAEDFRIQFPPGTRIFDRNLDTYLPPTQHGISDEYFDEVLNIASDHNMIDVHHVSNVRNQQVTSSLEDETTRTIEERGPDIIAETKGGWRWQAIVTVCALALTVLLLVLYYSGHCLNRAKRREN